MTSGERKALLFLAGVAVLGAAARVVTMPSRAPTSAEGAALQGQIAAVDSARGAAHDITSRPSKRARGAPVTGVTRTKTKGDAPVQAPAPAADTLAVDVDTADVRLLETLPGVGPALAARVVAERAARGPFGSLDGLRRVRGMGPKVAARLAARVTFSGVSRLPLSGVSRVP